MTEQDGGVPDPSLEFPLDLAGKRLKDLAALCEHVAWRLREGIVDRPGQDHPVAALEDLGVADSTGRLKQAMAVAAGRIVAETDDPITAACAIHLGRAMGHSSSFLLALLDRMELGPLPDDQGYAAGLARETLVRPVALAVPGLRARALVQLRAAGDLYNELLLLMYEDPDAELPGALQRFAANPDAGVGHVAHVAGYLAEVRPGDVLAAARSLADAPTEVREAFVEPVGRWAGPWLAENTDELAEALGLDVSSVLRAAAQD